MKLFCTFFLVIIIFITSCSKENEEILKEENMLREKIEKFVPTVIKYDESILTERHRIIVQKLYEASKIIDRIFLDQVYAKNYIIESELKTSKEKRGILAYQLFKMNFGPFDRIDHNRSFWGKHKKPAGANFYPEDITKEEFEKWIKENPDDEKAFTSEFTVIRRKDNNLAAIPYSEYYKEELEKAAQLLEEAADYSQNASLKKYLTLRAKAFRTNDYYESDMAWMDLKDHVIEVVIGPYEVYEDELFNYKASFESFLTIVDPAESKKLERFASYLDKMENNLPIPDEHKNFNRGAESPIVVVQQVFSAGDTKAGVQTLAFNLPNDERVRKAKGSKKVLLKNMHEAKFDKLLKPIAEKVLNEKQLKYVTFDAFFNHTLMHEISHGLGPGFIKINGSETEVKKELKETYSKIEECKADLLGMFNNIFMISQGEYPEKTAKEIWVTFLAGIFRSVRFGINEAHGGGNAIIYNYFLENGAYTFNEKTGKVSVNFEKAHEVLKNLSQKILMIQAEGNYNAAKELIAKYGTESPSLSILRKKLETLPIDIRPVFQIEGKRNYY